MADTVMTVRLTKLLNRYKKGELLEDVPNLLALDIPENQALGKKTKKEVASYLVGACLDTNITDVDILDLELQYVSFHPNSLTWRAYRMEQRDSAHPVAESDPSALCKRLQRYLNGTLDYYFTHDLKPTGHWLALRIQDKVPYTCYILRRPPAPFLLLAGLKKTHLELVLETLALALECHSYIDLNLSGKNLESLLDSLMYQHCQGTYSDYRFNQVDPNPLLAVASARSRKRPKLTSELSQEDKENIEDPIKRRRQAADEAFGTNPLPRLEKFSIQLQSMALPDSDETISCKIKFSGANVLEGIKESVACGCVTLPVPAVLKSLPRCSTNRVTVQAESEPVVQDSETSWVMELQIDENG